MSNTDDFTILLEGGRFSYTYVYKPYKNEDGNQTYTTHWIFPENHPQTTQLFDLIRKVAVAKWKDKAEEMLAAMKGQDKLCIHRGDVSKPGQAPYKGLLFLSASRKFEDGPPRIADENRNEITIASGKVYSGGKGNVIVRLWAQDNKYGKRINAELQGIQHTGHDEKLSSGGRLASLDEFKPVSAKDADSAAPSAASGLI